MEFVTKLKTFAIDLKTRLLPDQESSCDFIGFDQAVSILREELNYPEDRALHFVKRFDHNKDGKLSVAEFRQFKGKIEETKVQLVPKFKEYDHDKNGFITLDEASRILQNPPYSFPAGRVGILLRKFDKDGNGKLDIEEFADFYAEAKATNEEITKRFNELDRDHNGVLSPDEVTAVIRETMGYDQQRAVSLVQVFDKNQDGSLDKTEFMHLWAGIFG